jgi:hypothetical protein
MKKPVCALAITMTTTMMEFQVGRWRASGTVL